ncbi:permease, partial [bacterium]|nr:permease [bacterium]
MGERLADILGQTWLVTAQMAPWLLLGFAVAGFLSTVVAATWLERHLGGRGLRPVVTAAAFGVPLPLCSCGVIPVAASLRANGASRPATVAFLLSTPQTGVDSILVTWSLLGPLLAVLRPVIALVTGLVGGGLVRVLVPEEPRAAPAFPLAPTPSSGAAGGVGPRLAAALRYGLVTLPADLARPLLAGLLLAGLIGALAPADLAARYVEPGPWSILFMMLVGIPLYVCATASVPLAVGF